MKHPLDKINDEAQVLCSEIKSDLGTAGKHLEQIGDEYHRVTELSWQAARIVDQIDMDFKVKTKLNNRDITLLFLALALQCARQYFLSNDKFRLTAAEGDKLKKKILQVKIGGWHPIPPDVSKILMQKVPYDAVNFISDDVHERLGNVGLSGTTHRYRTLGHDPVLGWIFGTSNIVTSSLTRHDLFTLHVENSKIAGVYPGGVVGMFENANYFCMNDKLLLPTAVTRQAIHFGSDYFTKQGLPIPTVATVNNDLAATMIKNGHIDMWSVSRGATLATLINNLIACIHRLFYDEIKDGLPALYEVKTRKILSYSNTMATTSNVVVAAFTKNLDLLDAGGILVTIHRLLTDYKFIHEIKKDFLKNQLYDRIVGSEYDFMKGDF